MGGRRCRGRWFYLDEGRLALNAGLERVLLQLHHDVAPLHVPGDAGHHDIDLGDGLGPFVGQGILLSLLLGLGGRVGLGVWRGARVLAMVGQNGTRDWAGKQPGC